MRLIASPTALELLLALTQRREGARLAELASATDTSLSATQAAARLLLADHVITREPGRRPRYRLRRDHPAADALLELAARYPPRDRAVTVALRANPAVEFVSHDEQGYLIVHAPLADPRDTALLDEALRRIRGSRDGPPAVRRLGHHEIIDALRDGADLRRRAERATVLKGSRARSIPSRAPRSGRRGPRGGLGPVSRRALAALARTHGLRRILLFGSAARGALREDSDVDVLIEPRSGKILSLLDLVQLEADLERLLDRHVDVVTEGGLRPEVRERVRREAVTLHG